jgi:hypothetical protein
MPSNDLVFAPALDDGLAHRCPHDRAATWVQRGTRWTVCLACLKVLRGLH